MFLPRSLLTSGFGFGLRAFGVSGLVKGFGRLYGLRIVIPSRFSLGLQKSLTSEQVPDHFSQDAFSVLLPATARERIMEKN